MAEIVHDYRPRREFAALHKRTQRWALVVAHRRAGKTYSVINDMFVRAMRTTKKDAVYGYIAPTYGMAKDIAWKYIQRCVENFPEGSVKVRESETSIVLPNGAKIRCFGVNNPDTLRGKYFDGVICDEFGEWEGRAWSEVILPALSERQGWAVFIGTPKGPTNKFAQMRDKAMRPGSTWFYLELPASQTTIFTDRQLAELRLEMEPEEYEQEYECSFQAAVKGAYYGKHMADLTRNGAIGEVPYVHGEQVYCSFDIGTADATAVWFWQVIDGTVRYFDYFEATDMDAEQTLDMLELKPYSYEVMYLPHDARARHFGSKHTVIETFMLHNAPARIVPKQDLKDGIDAVRKHLRLSKVVFDRTRCGAGLKCLANYQRKWNKDAGVYSNEPIHDHWSNGADAFRYSAQSITQTVIQASIEKAQRQSKQAAAFVDAPGLNKTNVIREPYTFGMAWNEHDKQRAAERSEGRMRI